MADDARRPSPETRPSRLLGSGEPDRGSLLAYIAQVPSPAKEVIQRFPPHLCVRLTVNPVGHYRVVGYFWDSTNGKKPPTLAVCHGRDSFLPGVTVFGVPPEVVYICGCYTFEWATVEERIATLLFIEEHKRMRDVLENVEVGAHGPS